MREHTFVGDFDFSQKDFSLIDPALVHQVARVLRLEAGDSILLNNGKNMLARVRLKDIKKTHIDVTREEVFLNTSEPKCVVTLYAAVIKKDKFEWLVEKAVEAGVSEIVPVMGARSLKLSLNSERLLKTAREAVEQSGRGVVPGIREAMSFEDALQSAKSHDMSVLFDPSGKMSLPDFIAEKRGKASLGLFVGPEGGWTEEEILEAERAGVRSVSLGGLTLRAETAGLIAVFLAANDL